MTTKNNKENQNNVHNKHRERVKKQIIEDGFNDATPTHALLEALLFYSIPRIDTNPLAHKLIDRFGSLENALLASPEELMSVEGVGKNTATLFKLLNLIERRKLLEETDKVHYFKSDDEIAEYVLKRYSGLKEEHIALLCINQKGKILGFKIINEGDMSTVGFSTRKLAEVAINCGATTVILCHNHPSGMPLPSYLDEEATRGLQNTLSQFGIYLRDHLIVANNECYSMRKSGKYSDIFGSIR